MKEEEEDVPLRLVSLIAFPILTTDGGAEKSPQGLKWKIASKGFWKTNSLNIHFSDVLNTVRQRTSQEKIVAFF